MHHTHGYVFISCRVSIFTFSNRRESAFVVGWRMNSCKYGGTVGNFYYFKECLTIFVSDRYVCRTNYPVLFLREKSHFLASLPQHAGKVRQSTSRLAKHKEKNRTKAAYDLPVR